MTELAPLSITEIDLGTLAERSGAIAVFATEDGKLDQNARKVNSLSKKAVARLVESAAFEKAKTGEAVTVSYPAGLAAAKVIVVKMPRRPSVEVARKAGAAIAKARGEDDVLVLGGSMARMADVAFGVALRGYAFTPHKTGAQDALGKIEFMVSAPDEVQAAADVLMAVAEGIVFTRDLTNEPANHLTTTEFANRLKEMENIGLTVEVLDEDKLEDLGMGSLLCVGLGSASPSKVVVMQWNGGGDEAPVALVGKGVVFDTGGISLKPAGGMEDMTMDMGGAGVVSGVMRTLALRKARANVVGLVGLVENMPSDRATRPGDVVTSMKGDTIEVINTDAEGRLVLADVLWYAQERFKPSAVVDLATLTGAVIIALGRENAGVFSNDDALSKAFLKAAETEGEGAWRLPLGAAYDAKLKSRIADMKNVGGGRDAGSITAAQFLQRFIKEGTPWMHLDIAGVASVKEDTVLAPKGATGWGVAALNRLISDTYEAE
ncbi:leucyl aminopeptidase [Thalassorhabdomicrobium marinisediminis]|uniref:Probable cytosol aminopeptidase n=1 Tax=Thalassorhabdomicrobium marinisediminis TaxID=2170577 RepID=A0A2T7G136_9RHOB|nr:leucyl aminopeptidase [Thalassorhabdomicrobium marinisediminis]PVA08129.1 leucyl aminopeptidase [Thalassorhabdomicrobium marinisediminis]